MGNLSKGYTFGATETVTNAKLHTLVDSGAVTNIVNADINSGAAIDESKLSGDGSVYVMITGAQSIAGDKTFNNDVTVEGDTSVAALDASGNVTISGTTDLGGALTLTGALDVTGNVDITGDMTVSGAISGLFGTPVDKSSSYGAQQATTDGFVEAFCTGGSSSSIAISGYTDSNSNPTTLKHYHANNDPNAKGGGFTMLVKKNNYWKVTVSGQSGITVYWTPIGS